MFSKSLISSLCAGFLLLGILSCDLQRKEQSSHASTKESFSTQTLTSGLKEDQFFDIKQVKEVQSLATETQKIRSNTFLQKALILFAEEKTYDCIPYLVKSICDYPTPEAYFGLGSANLELGYFEDAIDAYHMAEWLNYEPLSDIYYNLSSAYFNDQTDLDGKNRAIKYLKLALENGYDNWKHFVSNKKFGEYRYEEEFLSLYLKHFQRKFKYKDQALFQLFVNLFPSQKPPIEVLLGDLNSEHTQDNPKISQRFDRLLTRSRKKIIPSKEQHYFKSFIQESDNYYALLYQSKPKPTRTNKLRKGATYYDLATYNKNGRMIDKLRFADNVNPIVFKAGIIDENRLIEVIKYKATWQKNLKKYGITNNQIEHFDLLSTETYLIDKHGRFVEESVDTLLGAVD